MARRFEEGVPFRDLWRPLVPAACGGALIVGYVLLVSNLETNLFSYPRLLTKSIGAIDLFFLHAWDSALAPRLLYGNAWIVIAGFGLATGACCLFDRNLRTGLAKRLKSPMFWALFLGTGVSLLLFLAIYFVTNRQIGDGRYAVPGNYAVALLWCLPAGATFSILRGWQRLAVGGTTLLAISAVFIGQQWREADWHTTLLAAAAVGIGLVVAAVAAAVCRKPAWFPSLSASAIIIFLCFPIVDNNLSRAGTERVDWYGWAKFVEQLKRETPENAHVILNFHDVLMITMATALEAEFIRSGRRDVVFHFDASEKSFFNSENGLVRWLVTSFNANRAPLPTGLATDPPLVRVRASRTGRGRSKHAPPAGEEAIQLFLRSPVDYVKARYIGHKAPFFEYDVMGVGIKFSG